MSGPPSNDPESADWRPRPDPTLLTTEQLIRTARAERDYVDAQLDVIRERLHGMDRATELLNATMNRVPTELQREISHLKELHDERFAGLAEALTVALSSAKDAVAAQDASNQKAINKAELTTGETISKLEQLFRSEHLALINVVNDLKERVTMMESTHRGAAETITLGRLNVGIIIAALAMLTTVITVVVVVIK